MDRPLGPRQPDKRLTAYETIFGRPGVSHHLNPGPGQSSPHSQNYSLPPNYPQSQYPYPSNQPLYSSPTRDRHSYVAQSPDSHQTFYTSPPPQSQSWSYSNYPYIQSQYSLPQPPLTPVPNNPLPLTIYPPPPDDPSDPAFNSPSRHGPNLSPHPYQAQAYHNNLVVHHQPSWGNLPPPVPPQQQQQQQQPPYEYENDLRYQNGSASRSYTNIPHLGVNIDSTNGRLGLDFDEETSPSDTEDSELPWANSQSRTSFSHTSQLPSPS
jgi:RHO1 GDP-GTP exchange protein 1/2